MENLCIVCGEIIPEGRQICPNCEKGGGVYDPVVGGVNTVYCRRIGRYAADGLVLRKRRLRGERK